MISVEKGMDPEAITKGEGPLQMQHEGLLPPSVVNNPEFRRQCMIGDINLPSAYRKQSIVDLNSLMACAVLQSLMSFDLARPRCVIEYDYCQRVADLDVMPEHDAAEEFSLQFYTCRSRYFVLARMVSREERP